MKAETRRVFLKNSVTAFAGSKLLRVTNQRCAASPNEKIIVGCVGIRGRGGSFAGPTIGVKSAGIRKSGLGLGTSFNDQWITYCYRSDSLRI